MRERVGGRLIGPRVGELTALSKGLLATHTEKVKNVAYSLKGVLLGKILLCASGTMDTFHSSPLVPREK